MQVFSDMLPSASYSRLLRLRSLEAPLLRGRSELSCASRALHPEYAGYMPTRVAGPEPEAPGFADAAMGCGIPWSRMRGLKSA
ncbi:hypothetical protein BH23GEM7_BH23GEM7_15900 [soil metagenome]